MTSNNWIPNVSIGKADVLNTCSLVQTSPFSPTLIAQNILVLVNFQAVHVHCLGECYLAGAKTGQ